MSVKIGQKPINKVPLFTDKATSKKARRSIEILFKRNGRRDSFPAANLALTAIAQAGFVLVPRGEK